MAGNIMTLYKDMSKTTAVFPRTKITAVSDNNGLSLETILNQESTKVENLQQQMDENNKTRSTISVKHVILPKEGWKASGKNKGITVSLPEVETFLLDIDWSQVKALGEWNDQALLTWWSYLTNCYTAQGSLHVNALQIPTYQVPVKILAFGGVQV